MLLELFSRAQEFLRIDRLAFEPRLVVQVRASRAPGRADLAHDLSALDRLADANVDRREVGVARGEPIVVVDINHPAVAAAPAGGDHCAVAGGAHGIAGLAVEIEPRMHCRRAQEGINAHAEARLQIDVAVDRLSHRNGAERTCESSNLRARDLDAVKLRLEARIPGGMGGHKRSADCNSLSAEIEPEFGQHAAYAPRLRIVILRHRADHRRLALLEAVEGRKQALDRAADAARAFGKNAGT